MVVDDQVVCLIVGIRFWTEIRLRPFLVSASAMTAPRHHKSRTRPDDALAHHLMFFMLRPAEISDARMRGCIREGGCRSGLSGGLGGTQSRCQRTGTRQAGSRPLGCSRAGKRGGRQPIVLAAGAPVVGRPSCSGAEPHLQMCGEMTG